MTEAQGRWGEFLLRYAAPLAGLRRVPVLGRCVSWVGEKLAPRDSLTWVQVQSGAARGLWLHLNPRTGRDYFRGGGEPEVQDVLEKYLRPGMTFYDVGANLGLFTLIGARLVGAQGCVVAFETDPEVAARLRENVGRNELAWVSVDEKAVWSEVKTVYFKRVDVAVSPDRGLGRVVPGNERDAIAVSAVSLDEVSLTHPLPDFIKCDVEGAEVEVFRGAKRLLKEKRPIIICEMHSDENRRVLMKEFEELQYACAPCGVSHVLAVPG